MLFSYAYVPHSMEKMQGYIDFIFYGVWCEAKGKGYDIGALFSANAELYDIITELHTSEVQGADFFLTGLQVIFEDFRPLDDAEIDQLKLWYRSNNDIEGVCAGNPGLSPATYEDIAALSPELAVHLKAFYKNLYSQSFLSLKSVKNRIGEIENHFHAFMTQNTKGKCPFCAITDIQGIYHTKREAYDHFLPKDKYPFNTINFHNLAPACHKCNSSYKLSADPLHFHSKNPLASGAGLYRKAFYPYSVRTYTIELTITLNTVDWTNITPDDIALDTGPDAIREEIDTWLDIYGVEERYKAKCCGEHDGKDWIREIVDESENYNQTPQQYLEGKLKTAANQPWADANFLKRPFLEACKGRGVFD